MSEITLNCKDLLTVKEVKEILNIGSTLTYRLITKGEIKSIKVGKSIKIPKIFLEEYLNNIMVGA